MDYDALATKLGGTVATPSQSTGTDYDNVAKLYGGAVATNPNAQPAQQTGDTGLKGFATGVAKSELNTIQNLGNAVLSPIKHLIGQPNLKTGISQSLLDPKSTAETVGNVAGNIGQFFIPGADGAEATQAINAADHIPQTLKLLAKYGVPAASAAGVTAAQGGSKSDSTTAAALSAAIPAAGDLYSLAGKTPVIGDAINALTEKLPARLVNSIIKPAIKDFNFGKNPGLAVADDGITALSRGSLLQKISDQKQALGTAIGHGLQAPEVASKIINAEPLVTKPIDDAVTKALQSGDKVLVNRLLDLKTGLTQELKIAGGEIVPGEMKNLTLNPLQTQQLKTEIGGGAKWTGLPFDNEINQVKVNIYRNLNDAIDQAAPGTKDLNARYADYLTAEKAMERGDKRLQALALTGIKAGGFGATGYLGGLLKGQDQKQAALSGLGLALGEKVAESTPAKTSLAKVLTKLAPGEQNVLFKAAPALKNLFLGLKTGTNQDGSTNETQQ